MAQLKRWESPRKTGRNDKGRGGAARQRQLKKQTQTLRRKLKAVEIQDSSQREVMRLSFLIPMYPVLGLITAELPDQFE
jgi:hypothetical protein